MKELLFLLSFLMAGSSAAAQDVMQQINAVKRAGGHLTAQYTHASADSAMAMGCRDILHQLNLQGYGLFSLDEVGSKIRHLQIPRGGQVRVFSYLKLTDVSKKRQTAAASSRIVVKPKFEVKEEKVEKKEKPAPVQRLDDAPSRLARDIMAQRDIDAAMNNLKIRKNVGIVLGYGPFAKGTDIDRVYIAIFDRTTKAPLTVLSPVVDGKRTNLVTKAEDSLSNYHGCRAIWISF